MGATNRVDSSVSAETGKSSFLSRIKESLSQIKHAADVWKDILSAPPSDFSKPGTMYMATSDNPIAKKIVDWLNDSGTSRALNKLYEKDVNGDRLILVKNDTERR